MTSFTFGGISYHSRRDMLTAIALDWLTAGGLNDEPAVLEILAKRDDRYLANDCLSHWSVIDPGTGELLEPAELAAEFAKLRRVSLLRKG